MLRNTSTLTTRHCRSDLLQSIVSSVQRWSLMHPAMISDTVKAFQAAYGQLPTFTTVAPGRVNLIGEHVDYSGYGVLPMALHQTVCVALREQLVSRVDVRNVDSVYPNTSLPANPDAKVGPHTWASYIHAAYKGASEYMSSSPQEARAVPPPGLQLMVHGHVPAGAGVQAPSHFTPCYTLRAMAAQHDYPCHECTLPMPVESLLTAASCCPALCMQSQQY